MKSIPKLHAEAMIMQICEDFHDDMAKDVLELNPLAKDSLDSLKNKFMDDLDIKIQNIIYREDE